jgi:hypothetical protein
MRKILLGLTVVLALVLMGSPAQSVNEDTEELVGKTAAATDNVGEAGDTATGGSLSSTWAECRSKRINKYHTRGTDSFYSFMWSIIGPVDERPIYFSETFWYRYCPNGIYPDKFKPLSWRYCHIHYPEGQVATFDGVGFTSYLTDESTTIEHPEKFVERSPDGTGAGSGGASCDDLIVPKESRRWFRVKRSGNFVAKYTTATRAQSDWIGDTVDMMGTDGESDAHTVKPQDDFSVGSWYSGTGSNNNSDLGLVDKSLPPGVGIPAQPFGCVLPEIAFPEPYIGCYDPTPQNSPSPWPHTSCPTSGGCDPNYPLDCAVGWTWTYGVGCTPNNQAACESLAGGVPVFWVRGSTVTEPPNYIFVPNRCEPM